MSAVKLRTQESSLDTSTPAGSAFKDIFLTEENNISKEDMSKMSKMWINIEDDIEIINQVVETELYAIDSQDEKYVFLINDDSEDENYLLVVPKEDNNYTKMEIMDFLDKINSH